MRRQVETIGDAYMVVSGAPEKVGNHAERVCDMALDMVDAITDLKDPSTGKILYLFAFVVLLHLTNHFLFLKHPKFTLKVYTMCSVNLLNLLCSNA